MEYFPHSHDVCPKPIWEWKTGLERAGILGGFSFEDDSATPLAIFVT